MADIGMSYTALVQTETTVQVLDTFIKPFEVPKQSKFSNFINQAGSVYHVPTRSAENPDQEFGMDHHTFARPIDQFFYQMEECRRRGILLNFCEHQWCYEPVRIIRPADESAIIKLAEKAHRTELVKPPKSPKSPKSNKNTFADDEDELGDLDPSDDEIASLVSQETGISDTGLKVIPLTKEELLQVYTPDQMKAFQQADHAGIWLDFDILQKDSVRKLGDESYTHIIQGVCRILRDSLDFEGCRNATGVVDRSRHGGIECKIHVVLLRKKDIRPENHHKYGSCYKDSFHIRIPTIKVTRGYKSYLRKQVRDCQELQTAFRDLSLVNTYEEIVDSGVVHASPMLLGSCKRGGREAHAIYKLYTATIRSTDAITMVQPSREFDPIEIAEGAGTPVVKKTRKPAAPPTPKYKWNLVYETSLLYENPDGLIKKRNFEPRAELMLEIKSLDERSAPGIMASADIDMIDHAVKNLCMANHEARFLMQCLDMLHPKRAENYQSWMRIILTLAKENPDYKPLAIKFSQRCPKQWANNGSVALEKLWNYGLNNPDKAHHDETDGDEALKSRNVRAIYNMAASDNPEAFRKCRSDSAYWEFYTKANEFEGKLNETHVGDILEKIFGNKFVTDKMIIGTKGSRVWYSFVTPDRKVQSHKSMYKWRFEADCPDTFDDCLSRTFPEYITKIITQFKVSESKVEDNEKMLAHIQNTVKNLEHMRYTLGNQSTIDKYIKRASRIFRRDDFIETLDTAEHVIGTMNGVLVLSPNTELVQAYNDYNITRSVTVDYVQLPPSVWVDKVSGQIRYAIPHDLSNPYKQAIQMAIEEIHAGEWDALEFNMCYLASAMDHKKKAPMFVIWLGGGANGKSFLLEMFIKMMGDVTRNGYGYKLNASFVTSPGKLGGGPDTQKMGLMYARFAYCSETNQMDKLYTSIIKEMTSDTMSGNEKYGTQKNFDVNTRFIMATNHPTRVEGNDHGIWRRLFVYWFKVTFKEHPDPKNKFERQMDPKKIEVWPKDRNFKQAFFSYMMDWYTVYRDKYQSNVLNVPRPTIDRESRKFREDSDVMCKFIKEILEYVGEQYYMPADELENDEDTTNMKIVDTAPIKLVEVAARYSDWYKANVDPKDVPPGMVIMQQLVKYPEIDKYIVEEGTGSNVLFMTKHILHGVGETWKPKKRVVKKAAATAEDGDPSEGMLPLTHHTDVVVPELARKRNANEMGNDSDDEPQDLDDQPEWLRMRGDNILDLADIAFPIAKDDEDVELKIGFPEFNSKEVNETLLAHLPAKERREMMSKLDPEALSKVKLDPLAELDDLTDMATSSAAASVLDDEDEDMPVVTERSLVNDIHRLIGPTLKSPAATKTVKTVKSSLPAATKLDKPSTAKARAVTKKPKAAAAKRAGV